MDIDKSLDEIIQAKPKASRGRGAKRGGSTPSSARARYASTVPRAAAQAAAPAKPLTAEAIKIIISNLPQDVTEAAVRMSAVTDMLDHNRMIDNQRPMKVEIAIDPNQAQSLASRVAAAPTRSAAPPRGRGRGRGGAKPRTARPAKKTAEELDAEMNAYKETSTA
ncbi:uncharacterized protein IL334_005438 [Kwoniella shivajii]|uniref:Chromatin target of PRMT1 protein C-terminal domain-containing protein n=1 Tax=Kwoniella shivajii TaxID=564305 RepID=A0ABZ1D4F8_9TREE|nr:hypothetical protein IL334_005438 [Kwoniella shivajii]